MSDEATIDYYNQNLDAYVVRTFFAEMEESRKRFLKYLPAQGRILDAGCGPGRDLLAFKEKGYDVLGFDAAEAMVRYVRDELKLPVVQGTFEEMEFLEEFDGIWASASLLHVPPQNLPDVFKRMWRALKQKGVLMVPLKEGKGVQKEGTRSFTYMREEALLPHLKDFILLDQWINAAQAGVNLTACQWLNTIVQKSTETEFANSL
jgi:SAM-dependent methyltransferase